jgi:hypothetical protein
MLEAVWRLLIELEPLGPARQCSSEQGICCEYCGLAPDRSRSGFPHRPRRAAIVGGNTSFETLAPTCVSFSMRKCIPRHTTRLKQDCSQRGVAATKSENICVIGRRYREAPRQSDLGVGARAARPAGAISADMQTSWLPERLIPAGFVSRTILPRSTFRCFDFPD